MLVHIWFGFFAVSFLSAIYQWLVLGHAEIFSLLIQSTFDMASLGVEIAIGLVGILCLWLGLFKIAEQSGLIQILARGLEPLFLKLMPGIPTGHPAHGSMTMNIAANMLGLDNAATPMGLKAMQDIAYDLHSNISQIRGLATCLRPMHRRRLGRAEFW